MTGFWATLLFCAVLGIVIGVVSAYIKAKKEQGGKEYNEVRFIAIASAVAAAVAVLISRGGCQ
jgi:cytochrome c oxidase assembly factor CtaG